MNKYSRPNYPDILGHITDQQRLCFGVVDVALALKPATPRSGEVFEAIVLLQNTVNDKVEVSVTPKLPTQDANGKEGCFAAQCANKKVSLAPGEVGYLSLPLLTLPDVAPNSGYKMSIDIIVNHIGKPDLIRHTDEPANPDFHSFIKKETLPEIAALQKLRFSANKSGRRHKGIETTFGLLASSKSKEKAPSKPAWHRLWTLADNTDMRLLMERHHTTFNEQILPMFTRENLYEPLYQATCRRFAGHGYQLQPDEVHYITKLLVHVLDLACQPPQSLDYPGQEIYQVGDTLKEKLLKQSGPLAVPGWYRAILTRIDTDSWIVAQPVEALSTLLYSDLLQDGILHGFELVHQAIGCKLGNDDDAVAYAKRFVNILRDKNAYFTFEDVYLPLILGGIIVDAQVVLSHEIPSHRLGNIKEHIRRQRPPGGPETQRIFIYSICLKVCDTFLKQYRDWV